MQLAILSRGAKSRLGIFEVSLQTYLGVIVTFQLSVQVPDHLFLVPQGGLGFC